MTIKNALYRELRWGPTLAAWFDPTDATKIKLDMRSVPSKAKAEIDYPNLVFRRKMYTQDNTVAYGKEMIEIEVIGLRTSATKGDSLLEKIRTALLNEFSMKTKTWGKFDANGNADPTGGLLLHCQYLSTNEGFSSELDEKAHILLFLFAFVRS